MHVLGLCFFFFFFCLFLFIFLHFNRCPDCFFFCALGWAGANDSVVVDGWIMSRPYEYTRYGWCTRYLLMQGQVCEGYIPRQTREGLEGGCAKAALLVEKSTEIEG